MKILFACAACAAVVLAQGFLYPASAAPAAMEGAAPVTFKVGKATVYSLQDVERRMSVETFKDAGMEKLKKLAPEGSVPSSVYVFLIRSGKTLALVDTGYGKAADPKSWLLPKMAAIGVKPQDITHVLLTHLHGDHVGGLAWEGKAAFPNAEVLVSDVENAYWTNPETLKTNPGRKANIELIMANFAMYPGKIKTFPLGGDVLPGITSVAAVGHTPGHSALLLESEGARMLFWGDLVHGAALQFQDPTICAVYDMDKPKAVGARIALMDLAAKRNIPVAGAHLPAPGVFKVKAGKAKDTFSCTPAK